MAMKNRQQTLRLRSFTPSGRRVILLFLLVGVLFFFTGRVEAQDEIDQEKLQQGAELYNQNCAVCHGPDGEGRVGVTLAKDWPSIRPDLEVENTIINGVPGSPMPAWSQENGGPLDDEQIDAIVYYILSWQSGGIELVEPLSAPTSRPPMTPIPGLEGDPNQGAILYDNNCAVCHGPNGEGRIGVTLAKVWPSIRPDLSIKTTISNGVSGSVMPAWSQANGGPLTEEEITDVVVFLLTLSEEAGGVTGTTSTPESTVISPGAEWIGLVLGLVLFGVFIAVMVFVQRKK